MTLKKIKNKRVKIFILFTICLLILPVTVTAENYRVIFNHLDGIGDDYGPGYYHYPQNHIFQNKGHLFDLQSLTIFESENDYKIRFSFSELTDPWGAEFGFSLPLIELYLDNQSGGSNQLFHEGANVKFKDDFYWNNFLKVSGWWVRLFHPDSKKDNILNVNDFSFNDPNANGDLQINKEGNDLYLLLPKSEIKSLQDSKLIVLIGSFDPFGYDHFRSLANSRSYWQLYSDEEVSAAESPRVLDILLPGGQNQKKVLSSRPAVIPYLEVAPERPEREKNLVDYLLPVNQISLLILLLYIIFVALIIYKFKYKK